jgi:anti-sigma regulatory factor (Ser/Thr protein kinase)
MEARIRDEGNGFDPAAAADPRSAERLLETSGRGLLMMTGLVDRVRFRRPQRGGMEVILTKMLSKERK